jgi:hypothetical protein
MGFRYGAHTAKGVVYYRRRGKQKIAWKRESVNDMPTIHEDDVEESDLPDARTLPIPVTGTAT